MTESKPIMIDGINVSECEFYNTDDKTCREVNGKYDTDICEFDKCENSNCYFKQLVHKTRECEKWKLQATSLSYADTICALEIDLEHKTQECEELKKYLKRIEEYCKEQNLKADYTACEVLQIIDEVENDR